MEHIDVLIVLVVVVVLTLAGIYVIREKKKGNKCIGCPNSGVCNGKCSAKD